MKRHVGLGLGLFALSAFVGCSQEEEQAPPPVVRPVLSVVVAPASERRPVFAGTVQPRYQTDRGFQVLGRIIARHVEVGDIVRPGQTLAENDPLPYQLAVRSSEADLATAKAELDRARAKRERTATLTERKISTQADLDADDQANDAAAAAVRQAEAGLVKSREQLRYTKLIADSDGVVTGVFAEVGQVASPGMRVMTIARTDVREAVVDLPADVVGRLAVGSPFQIVLQADPSVTVGGNVREIGPQADAVTRTRRVRVTLDRAVDPFRLGATITARPLVATAPDLIEAPLSALLERDGSVRVWVVDPVTRTVRSVPVEVAGRTGSSVQIAKGLEAGARVVVAGVSALTEAQAVKLEEGTAK